MNPTLATIRRETGEQNIKGLLTLWLIDLIQFFNVSNTMNPKQVDDTIDLILTYHYYLKPDDIKLCFNRMKAGMLGTLYNRLDGSIILDILNKYSEERIKVSESKSDDEHTQSKLDKRVTKEAAQLLKKLTKDITSEEEEKERKYQEFKRIRNEERSKDHGQAD